MLQVIEAEEAGDAFMADVIAPIRKRVEPRESEAFFAVGQKWVEISFDGKFPEQVSLYSLDTHATHPGDRMTLHEKILSARKAALNVLAKD